MKQRLLSILLNPYVIALAISGIVILITPDYFNKYQVKLESSEFVNGDGNSVVYYTDLDGDHKSEKIIAQNNNLGNASFLFYDSDNNFIDQYNFEGQFPDEGKNIWFQDSNDNQIKEIYLISRIGDSAFLNSYEPKDFYNFNPLSVFIDTISSYKNEKWLNVDFSNGFPSYEISDSLVVFRLFAGYSCYPRNIYQYHTPSKEITKSPHLTNSMGIEYRYDLDKDGKLEYLLSSTSPGNDNAIKFSGRTDYSTWLTVLDDNLQFLFEPIEFKALGSIETVPDRNNNVILGVFRSKHYSSVPSKLFKIDLKGQILKEVILPNQMNNIIFELTDRSFAFYEHDSGIMNIYDMDLNFTKSVYLNPHMSIYRMDVNQDGTEDFLGFSSDNKTATIWDQALNNSVTFNIFDNEGGTYTRGIKQTGPNQSLLYFHRNNELNLFSYEENPLYIFKYLSYIGIYGLMLLLIWLIIKGQKLREAKQRAIEQEIADLQLKTIKNQVDPHFVFNAINTISEMTLMDNKLEADRFISRFSGFMRDTLQHSDKISTTLKDELEYTENFIQLQQIRFNHRFKYQIDIEKGVDLKTLIPKHVLFTYAENAIKHGLRSKDQGLLQIKASKDKAHLKLSIENTGEGLRQSSAPKSHSTGSGLNIMQRIFELYTKRYNRNITHEVKDLYDEHNHMSGLRVDIYIEYKTN